MKITVVKKASTIKPSGTCPSWIDAPPLIMKR
jgi:hypothetical protein